MRTFIATAALAAFAGAAHAGGATYSQELGTGALDDGAQIETGGPGSAPFFMNAQGNDDQFAEFYVMRFDLSAYSGVAVDSVTIDLRHSEPFFAASGGVRLSYSADDSTAFSALSFDTSSVGGNNGQLSATEIATFDFIDAPGDGNTDIVDTIVLNDFGGFFADIASQGIVTLILEAAEPGTAATYTGISANDGGPVLNITEIPAPGAAALFGLAGLSAARRRR
jgi:hypothetical protein